MSNKIIVSALAAAALASGSAAFAQDHDYDRDNGWQQQQQQQEQRADERWQRERDSDRDARWRAQRDYEREQRWQWRHRHDNEREDGMQGGWGRTESFSAGYDGAGPQHDLRRGDRLPSRYRTNQYVVDNWRRHRLHRPPHGYHWVQTGADYVLVRASNGVIAQIILSQ